MTNAPFGGDGPPNPPKTLGVDGSPSSGVHAGNFSDQNPPGFDGEVNAGAAAVAAPSNSVRIRPHKH